MSQSVGVELTRGDGFIAGQLLADAALAAIVDDRVYADQAPPKAVYPMVVFHVQDPGRDTVAAGAFRVMARPVYLVKAIHRTALWQDLEAAADRIDRVLHRSEGPAGDDGTVISCVRAGPFRMPENRDNVSYLHLGAFFRLLIQVEA